MKTYQKLSFSGCAVLISAFLIHCSSQTKNTDPVAKIDAGWSSRMQGMATNLEKLMPFVFSRQEFTDPKNHEQVTELIANFYKSVELVPKHVGEEMLGKDPLVKFAIGRLESNTAHAIQAYNEGHMEFSRNTLRENLGLCFSCHTTTQLGPQHNFSAPFLKSNFRVYPSERAEYYVATRQFDLAISVLESVLKTPADLLDDPHEQVQALRKFLSLEVRVKNDPGHAAAGLEKFLASQKLPYFISADVEAWLKSLRDWQKEKKSKLDSFSRAQILIKKAKDIQASGGFQSGYIEYLRGSMLLHESLRETQDTSKKAKVYEMLGQSYETLAEMGTWDLPEVYYEACVRTDPKSRISQRCYKDFERSIVLGFSGSAGIFIPKEERERLIELKNISGL